MERGLRQLTEHDAAQGIGGQALLSLWLLQGVLPMEGGGVFPLEQELRRALMQAPPKPSAGGRTLTAL